MAPALSTPRRYTPGRRRGRPPSRPSSARGAGPSDIVATEPPPKRRRYIPGGPGGGGRFIDDDGVETPAEASASASARQATASRSLATPLPKRERSTRMRTAVSRYEPDDEQYSSAAAVAAAVVQSEGYKPREERGWEEFHPNLDIAATFMVFHADEVDGVAKSPATTPAPTQEVTPVNGASTPSKDPTLASTSAANTPNAKADAAPTEMALETTPRRRIGRPTRDTASLYAFRVAEPVMTPKTPKVLPIQNQTPKERLDLKLPSYRKTDRILLFESKTFGQARYVDKAMSNVGYQESDNFVRPERRLIKASDANVEEDLDQASKALRTNGDTAQHMGPVGRVEYDMDEQDDMWLDTYNAQRKASDLDPITREVFEITITKVEKEWHALEKRIPKPNPKPPQTHRPRSSSAVAVNGETQAGEEQDSKCAICDDGDCENTNAIVFCDGCDLAVHQECYGVPFIPEGQWLCRKCQLIGRGIPTCIFCPNTDGAFKQTNSSKWAHLLCAMWIPEVSLGNHTFMEPVMDVDKVPKTRWRLTCYICNQRMGACIQCSNKACYQAFHVTCARRAHLYLKMKNSQGALAVLDGSMVLKAFCDKHCPPDYTEENSVFQATREAKRFYRRTMKGRIWADSQASALAIAATHRHAITEHPPDESQMTGAKLNAVLGDKKKGQPGKPIWKLPSGAPVIPQAVFDNVETSLQRFTIRQRKNFIAEACRYWTLKREARRGAALLKRLQLQMESFSSMEITRRNFAAMGPSGKSRLVRRIEFAKTLIKDLEQLKTLSEEVVQREMDKLDEAELEQEFVDTCYFPVYKMLVPVIEKAMVLDKEVFHDGLAKLQSKLGERLYTTTLAFAHDLCEVIHVGINMEVESPGDGQTGPEAMDVSPPKNQASSEAKERKRLGKRILKSVQAQLETALRAESDINHKPLVTLVKELEGMIEASLELRQPSAITVSHGGSALHQSQDVIMVDAAGEGQITVSKETNDENNKTEDGEQMEGVETGAPAGEDDANEAAGVGDSDRPDRVNGVVSSAASAMDQDVDAAGKEDANDALPDGVKSSDMPPATDGYVPATQPSQPGPLTPPQSNGSLGGRAGPAASSDPLGDGGVPWYLSGFSLAGTSAVEEQWAGRDAVRSLSEDLTDMDDEELNGLEFDVADSTITASPMNPTTTNAGPGPRPSTARREKAALGAASTPSSSATKKRTTMNSSGGNRVTKQRLRASTRRR